MFRYKTLISSFKITNNILIDIFYLKFMKNKRLYLFSFLSWRNRSRENSF